VDEVSTVVRVRDVGTLGQVETREGLASVAVELGENHDPWPPFLVVHHQNAVVVVLGVRLSALDGVRRDVTAGLMRAESREEAEIDQNVRELADFHLAPPLRHLAGLCSRQILKHLFRVYHITIFLSRLN